MPINRFEPTDPYQHFVIEYWHLEYKQESKSPPFQILPDGTMELIFNYGDPYSVSIKGKKFTINRGVFLRGICLSPITLQMGKNIQLWGVRINPIWVSSHLGVNPKVNFENVISLDEFNLKNGTTPTTHEDFFDRFAKQVAWNAQDITHPNILKAINEIEKHHGTLTIIELAKKCFMSVSSLERNFKIAFGISPKAYSQLTKFKFIANQLASNVEIKQLDLISAFNLTDQSHLNKITKSFSNETPEQMKAKISRYFTKLYFVE